MLGDKLAAFAEEQRRLVWLAPLFHALPIAIQRFDEPLFPYTKVLVQDTQDLAAGYVFDLARFLAFGAAGAVALERSMRYVPATHAVILHGAFADAAYARLIDTLAFGGDALTVLNASIARACQAIMPQTTCITLEESNTDFAFWQRSSGILQFGELTARVTTIDFLQKISTEDFVARIRQGLAAL